MTNRGVTLFIAIIVTATLLLVSSGIISLAVKQSYLTNADRSSQDAFYAADTGGECALYWDLKNPTQSAFATSTNANIVCNGESFTVGGASGQSFFTLTFPPAKYCAEVEVTRRRANPNATPPIKSTLIQSYGYNDCDVTNPRRVQRAIQITY